MISREMIQKGYETGVIQLLDLLPNAVGCAMGGFYITFEANLPANTIDEYKQKVPEETIVSSIYDRLKPLKAGNASLYSYYEDFLRKRLEVRERKQKRFAIRVEEILARTVIVEAADAEEAISKVDKAIEDCEIVLEYDDFTEINVSLDEYWKNGEIGAEDDVSHYWHLESEVDDNEEE